MAIWNPWHGCHKISAGCQNCYVFRRDESIGKQTGIVSRTKDFDLPMRRDQMKQYVLTAGDGVVYTCMTSDFFVEEADAWRPKCWKMMKTRQDLSFVIITKRIHRFVECIPPDWGDGYPNVTICSTCENQDRADFRLPILLEAPIRHRQITHEPMLGPVDIRKYLKTGKIEKVVCGGESGRNARLCDYTWVLDVRKQCMEHHVEFYFKQTGAVFSKDGKVYRIDRKDQIPQAQKAEINYAPDESDDLIQSRISREEWLRQDLFMRISGSPFRSRFRLKSVDMEYIEKNGMDRIRKHAEDFVQKRLAPAYPENDGKQTPMRGHPVFLAQHACACCCRECLQKWHNIPTGIALTDEQQRQIVDILIQWIRLKMTETKSEQQLTIAELKKEE